MILFDDDNKCFICKLMQEEHNKCQINACKTQYRENREIYVNLYIERRVKDIIEKH